MQGDPNQADSKRPGPDRNATSTEAIVREMEMVAKRFEETSSPLRPARILPPGAAARARNTHAPPPLAVPATHDTHATSKAHRGRPRTVKEGPPKEASDVAQGAVNALNTYSTPPSTAPENRGRTSSTASAGLSSGGSQSRLSASKSIPVAPTSPEEADPAELDNNRITSGRRSKFDDEDGDSDVVDSWDAAEDSEVEAEKAREAAEARAKKAAEANSKADRHSTVQPETVGAAEFNYTPRTRRAALPEMRETGATPRAVIAKLGEVVATPLAHAAASIDNSSTVTNQDTISSTRSSQSYLSDEPFTEQPSADRNLAYVSHHTILPRLPIASWTDNRVFNIIKNQSIGMFNEASKSANLPISISAASDSSASSDPSASPFTVLGSTARYLMDAYSVVLSWVIRYNWRLVPLLILTLSFLLSWVGGMTYAEIVKHAIKYCMCRTSIFQSWDFCTSILPAPSILEPEIDHQGVAQHALSLVHDLAITSELFTIAKQLEQAHYNLYMFNVEANDSDLIALSQNYIENSDILQDDLQDFLTNITVTVQWIEYLTSELANDLTYTLSTPTSEAWPVNVWRWIFFSEQSTAVNVTELHSLYTNYLVALIETTSEQITAHVQISNSFKLIYEVIPPLTAKTNKAHLQVQSAVEKRKYFWLLLQRLYPSQDRNELDEKAINVELLRAYLDQAAPKLGDARQGLEGTKRTLKALLQRALKREKQRKRGVRWYSNVDQMWSHVQFILQARTGIKAVKEKVAKRRVSAV